MGWWSWSSCNKFEWSSSEAIILFDDLLLSSYTAGWVGLFLIHIFGLKAFVPEYSYIFLENYPLNFLWSFFTYFITCIVSYRMMHLPHNVENYF